MGGNIFKWWSELLLFSFGYLKSQNRLYVCIVSTELWYIVFVFVFVCYGSNYGLLLFPGYVSGEGRGGVVSVCLCVDVGWALGGTKVALIKLRVEYRIR